MMHAMLQGGTALASLAVALFFLRFWHESRDRFFLYFALSFALDAASRVALVALGPFEEHQPYVYVVRLMAYLLIVAAIVDKNLGPRRG